MLYGVISATASGDNTVVPAIAGMRIRVLGYVAMAAGTVAATWKSDSTSLSGAMTIGTGNGLSVQQSQSTAQSECAVIQTEPGAALILNLSAAVAVGGHINYKYVQV